MAHCGVLLEERGSAVFAAKDSRRRCGRWNRPPDSVEEETPRHRGSDAGSAGCVGDVSSRSPCRRGCRSSALRNQRPIGVLSTFGPGPPPDRDDSQTRRKRGYAPRRARGRHSTIPISTDRPFRPIETGKMPSTWRCSGLVTAADARETETIPVAATVISPAKDPGPDRRRAMSGSRLSCPLFPRDRSVPDDPGCARESGLPVVTARFRARFPLRRMRPRRRGGARARADPDGGLRAVRGSRRRWPNSRR